VLAGQGEAQSSTAIDWSARLQSLAWYEPAGAARAERAGCMHEKAIERAALITLRRAICERFPPEAKHAQWLPWACVQSRAEAAGPARGPSHARRTINPKEAQMTHEGLHVAQRLGGSLWASPHSRARDARVVRPRSCRHRSHAAAQGPTPRRYLSRHSWATAPRRPVCSYVRTVIGLGFGVHGMWRSCSGQKRALRQLATFDARSLR
jgi:hypothetical protein